MPDYGHDLQLGVFVTPLADQADGVLALAKLADALALDLVTFQDHPYQPRFLDTLTLLSVVAAQTANVRVAPNVVNLPLRPPRMLARAIASLDVLSGGRVELGLGAGAFWDGIQSMGGPRLTPGQSVDALEEALTVIRAAWEAGGAGPAPAHPVEIWLGAYKPRMLRLTGARADGWLPSQGYLDMDRLGELNAAIDDAAAAAGRRPGDVRRLLNVNAGWEPEQLAGLALEHGTSAFILAVSSGDELRRFAEDVAPAVRELVETARGRGEGAAAAPPAPPASAAPPTFAPTPDDGVRRSPERLWDESTRPAGPARDPDRRYTAQEQAAGRHLIDVHDHLRSELDQLRDLVGQVARGHADPAAVRSFVNRMTIRQNHWTLGLFCESYCRVVTTHHTLEDRSVFPHLRRSEPGLVPVLDRLGEEHEAIAELLERVDQALVALVSPADGIDGVQAAVDLLTDALLSHFAYEERALVEPLARHGFY